MVPEDDDEGTAKTDAVVVIILLLPRSPATSEGSGREEEYPRLLR